MSPAPEFRPGFRFSAFDALLLVVGLVGAALAWPKTWWPGLVIAFVVGHFFLFCNVFRISRGLELIWALNFIVLTRFTIVNGFPSWTATVSLSLAVTFAVIGIGLRKPSYHGIGWRRVNPKLPQWWESFIAGKDEPHA